MRVTPVIRASSRQGQLRGLDPIRIGYLVVSGNPNARERCVGTVHPSNIRSLTPSSWARVWVNGPWRSPSGNRAHRRITAWCGRPGILRHVCPLWMGTFDGTAVDAFWALAERCLSDLTTWPRTVAKHTARPVDGGPATVRQPQTVALATAPCDRRGTDPSHRDSRSVRIGRITYELGKGTGPLRSQGGRGRRDRPGAARVHDPGGPGRRRDPGRAARRTVAHRRVPRPAQPGPAERGAQPQGARGGADRARPGRERRRAGRGDAAGRGRAARVGPEDATPATRAWSTAG